MGKQNSKERVGKLSDSDLKKIALETQFTKSQLKEWYNDFMEEWPSGKVTSQEFPKIYSSLFPFGNGQAFSLLAFDLYDLDKNGSIDFNEFMMALSTATRGSHDDRLKWAFQLYDIDKDGTISQEDMLSTIQAIYQLVGTMVMYPPDEATPELRTKKLFDLLDSDRDGKVTFEEFKLGSKNDPTIFKALTIYDEEF